MSAAVAFCWGRGSVCSGCVCPDGVSSQGVSAQGVCPGVSARGRGCMTTGCLPREGCLPRGSAGGVCPGECLPGGSVCPGEGYLHRGVWQTPLLWTEFLTHACVNITFPQLRLRMVKSGHQEVSRCCTWSEFQESIASM